MIARSPCSPRGAAASRSIRRRARSGPPSAFRAARRRPTGRACFTAQCSRVSPTCSPGTALISSSRRALLDVNCDRLRLALDDDVDELRLLLGRNRLHRALLRGGCARGVLSERNRCSQASQQWRALRRNIQKWHSGRDQHADRRRAGARERVSSRRDSSAEICSRCGRRSPQPTTGVRCRSATHPTALCRRRHQRCRSWRNPTRRRRRRRRCAACPWRRRAAPLGQALELPDPSARSASRR